MSQKRLVVLVPLAAAVVVALLSNGSYQDDDLVHFLMARWSWSHPQYLADDWGRPGFTAPYALVSNIGPPAVGFMLARLMTVAVTAAVAWVTWRVADELIGLRWAWLAPAALVTMPLYFRLSYTTLTETIGSLYVALGTWLLLKDRPKLAAVAFSMLPLTRHEGIALLPAIGLLLAWRRAWSAIPLLLVGEVAWNVGKRLLGYDWAEIALMRFFDKGEAAHLGSGGPLHYLMKWAEAAGPGQVALGVVGGAILSTEVWRRLRTDRRYEPRIATMIVVAGGTFATIAVQTLLYMFNTHESGGYARFLLPAASWMAICTAAGAAWLIRQNDWRMIASAAVAMAAVGVLTNIEAMRQGYNGWWGWPLWYGWITPVAAGATWLALRPCPTRRRVFLYLVLFSVTGAWAASVRPYRLRPHQRLVAQVSQAIAEDPRYAGHSVTADNPWVMYFANRPFTKKEAFAPDRWRYAWPKHRLIYLWDAEQSPRQFPLAELKAYPYRRLSLPEVPMLRNLPPKHELQHFVTLFERLPDAPPPQESDQTP